MIGCHISRGATGGDLKPLREVPDFISKKSGLLKIYKSYISEKCPCFITTVKTYLVLNLVRSNRLDNGLLVNLRHETL